MAEPAVQVINREGIKIARLINIPEFNLFSMNKIKQQLQEAIAERPEKIIIDLCNVDYIDSSGIGTLIAIRRNVTAYKGSFYITGLNFAVSQVFAHTKLDQLFKILPSVEDAIDSTGL